MIFSFLLGEAFRGGSSPGFSLHHEIVRVGIQSAPLLQRRNRLQEILLVMIESTPPHCSTTVPQLRHTRLTEHQSPHPVCLTTSNWLRVVLSTINNNTQFLPGTVSNCSLTSPGKAQAERDYFPCRGSIEYYKKSLQCIFYYLGFYIHKKRKEYFNNLVI